MATPWDVYKHVLIRPITVPRRLSGTNVTRYACIRMRKMVENAPETAHSNAVSTRLG